MRCRQLSSLRRSFSTTNITGPSSISDHQRPNSSFFSDLLQSCIDVCSILDVSRVHCRILKTRFSSETFIQNRLIDAYSKCRSLQDSQKLFYRVAFKNVFSWNSMLAALTRSGYVEEAAALFEVMPERDDCSWNSLVSGFAQDGMFEEAVGYFLRMRREDGVVFVGTHALSSCLSASAGLVDTNLGCQIHALVLKYPFFSDVYLGSALVDMYSKCGRPIDARMVFDTMSYRNVVTWNSLITCYEQNGHAMVALDLFVEMMEQNSDSAVPDEVTFASVVSACAALAANKEGRQIHARVVKLSRFSNDLILNNALVDMYAKCGRILEARRVFDRMPVKNVVSETSIISGYAKSANVSDAVWMFSRMKERNVIAWNALIAGYIHNGENEEALKLFRKLKTESLWPTHYTFGNILSACGSLTDLQLGRQIHGHVLKHGFGFEAGPNSDIFVGNSLVDMYFKCGNLADGSKVFEKMTDTDRVSWNAMIVGNAQNGRGAEALALFRKMLAVGESPDHVTMIGVLTGCSHAGLVDEGIKYFKSMREDHGIPPSRDHYTCLVDLLGRAGRFADIEKFVNQMTEEPDAVLWGSFLASCRLHRNVEMGEVAARRLLELNPKNSSPYVLLSNIYAEKKQWDNALRVRKLMKSRGVVKQPGCSWIEIERKVYVFMVRDGTNPQKKDIYNSLRSLRLQMKKIDKILSMDDELQLYSLREAPH